MPEDGEMVIVILEVSNLGTSQPVVHRGKISKLASFIDHTSAPDNRQLC